MWSLSFDRHARDPGERCRRSLPSGSRGQNRTRWRASVEKSGGAIMSDAKLPILLTPLPGPKAKEVIARDAQFVSPSYTRGYPLVAKSGRGAMVEDVDGNAFLDFAAGIAVVSTGHCHPRVVEAIQKQAAELLHISGTDFYSPNMVDLAERLVAVTPGKEPKK